jgi:hypothetical protein
MTNRLLLTLAIASVAAAQEIPAKRTAAVKILQGPETERVDPDFAILRWTSNNPGGTDKHYGVVHYGTEPKKLDQVAKSPIRLNRTHTETVFRVRMERLKPATTYYYTVDEEEAGGDSDKVQCAVKRFSTPPASASH